MLSTHHRPFSGRPECTKEQSFGLYCAKYQRFYCAGSDNCGSVESYMKHFDSSRGMRGRS